ncbi:MAG: tetrahydrofolate dehydrogenase/cyclohydrolase catalytic domain-containing protein [Methanobacteriota archaeon]
MTAQIIDGAKKALEIKASLKKEVKTLSEKGVTPALATILVGDDSSSRIYLKLKEKACVEVGIKSNQFELPADASEGEVISLITKLNSDELVHGILVQLPLPKHLNEYKTLSNINPSKDVDGFHPQNLGKLAFKDEALAPATPKGIVVLLEDLTRLEGKNVCIVNHSIVVGKPLALMLLSRNATVDVCHVYTKNLANHTKAADILISATGVPKLIKKDMVAEGAIVIDVGVSKTEEGITGDVDFEKVKEKASHITPVPGGVGPMTIAILLQNTITAASQAHF